MCPRNLCSARDFDLSLMVLTLRLDGLPLSKMERVLCGTGCDESAWVEGLLNGDSLSDSEGSLCSLCKNLQLPSSSTKRGTLTPPRILYNPCMERYRTVKDVGLCYVTFTVVEWLPSLSTKHPARSSPIALTRPLPQLHERKKQS